MPPRNPSVLDGLPVRAAQRSAARGELARGNAVAAFALGNHGDWEGLPSMADLRFAGILDDTVR